MSERRTNERTLLKYAWARRDGSYRTSANQEDAGHDRTHFWRRETLLACYTEISAKGCCTNGLRVAEAVSVNKHVRTPASFYYLLGGKRMRFHIGINCGAEVYFIGHEKGDHFLLNPPKDSGRWKIDLVELESRLSGLLSSKKFGRAVDQYCFRLEIADFEKWGEWFTPGCSRVVYRPKSRSVESVGQLRWHDIACSIANVSCAKRKPKDFDCESFLEAVLASLDRIPVSDVRAVRAA